MSNKNNVSGTASKDGVFKELMLNEDILKMFIEDVTGVRYGKLEYVNGEFPPEIETGKGIRMDLLVLADDKVYINIEIQTSVQKWIRDRLVYYAGRLMSWHMEAGDKYESLLPVTSIGILNYRLKENEDREEILSYYGLHRDDKKAVEGGNVIYLLETPKQNTDTTSPELALWCEFLSTTKGELSVFATKNPKFQQASKELEKILSSKKTNLGLIQYERSLLDETMSGVQLEETQIKFIKYMLRCGEEESSIAQEVQVSLEDVLEVKRGLHG